MRLLQGLEDDALPDRRIQRARGGDLPVLAAQDVGRFARPDRQHLIDRFARHRLAVLIQRAENFRIRAQPARADAQNEAPVAHVIDHRDLRRHRRRMAVRQVDGAGAEADLPRLVGKAGDEGQRGGDGLGQIRHVLADESFGKAQLVRQQDGGTVFA